MKLDLHLAGWKETEDMPGRWTHIKLTNQDPGNRKRYLSANISVCWCCAVVKSHQVEYSSKKPWGFWNRTVTTCKHTNDNVHSRCWINPEQQVQKTTSIMKEKAQKKQVSHRGNQPWCPYKVVSAWQYPCSSLTMPEARLEPRLLAAVQGRDTSRVSTHSQGGKQQPILVGKPLPPQKCFKGENENRPSTFLSPLLSGSVYVVLELDSNLPFVWLIPYKRVFQKLLGGGPLHVILH